MSLPIQPEIVTTPDLFQAALDRVLETSSKNADADFKHYIQYQPEENVQNQKRQEEALIQFHMSTLSIQVIYCGLQGRSAAASNPVIKNIIVDFLKKEEGKNQSISFHDFHLAGLAEAITKGLPYIPPGESTLEQAYVNIEKMRKNILHEQEQQKVLLHKKVPEVSSFWKFGLFNSPQSTKKPEAISNQPGDPKKHSPSQGS